MSGIDHVALNATYVALVQSALNRPNTWIFDPATERQFACIMRAYPASSRRAVFGSLATVFGTCKLTKGHLDTVIKSLKSDNSTTPNQDMPVAIAAPVQRTRTTRTVSTRKVPAARKVAVRPTVDFYDTCKTGF